jgi:hypothetical protein
MFGVRLHQDTEIVRDPHKQRLQAGENAWRDFNATQS